MGSERHLQNFNDRCNNDMQTMTCQLSQQRACARIVVFLSACAKMHGSTPLTREGLQHVFQSLGAAHFDDASPVLESNRN